MTFQYSTWLLLVEESKEQLALRSTVLLKTSGSSVLNTSTPVVGFILRSCVKDAYLRVKPFYGYLGVGALVE